MLVESSNEKMNEMSKQVVDPGRIIKEISVESIEKINEKETIINDLLASISAEKELRDKNEDELKNQIKKLKLENRKIVEEFDSLKKEKESVEEMIELNNSDIEVMTGKLEKKRQKYKNSKVTINLLKSQLASRDELIKELTEKKKLSNSDQSTSNINSTNDNLKLTLEIKDLMVRLDAEKEINENCKISRENTLTELEHAKQTIIELDKQNESLKSELENSKQYYLINLVNLRSKLMN